MYLVIGDEVRDKEEGPVMIVTGYASGIVECCWYEGHGMKREAFRKEELIALSSTRQQLAS